jgi:hypothetical protein
MAKVRTFAFVVFCASLLSVNVLATEPCQYFGAECDCGYCGAACMEVTCYTLPSCAEAYPDFCADVDSACYQECDGLIAGMGCDSGNNCYAWCQCDVSKE